MNRLSQASDIEDLESKCAGLTVLTTEGQVLKKALAREETIFADKMIGMTETIETLRKGNAKLEQILAEERAEAKQAGIEQKEEVKKVKEQPTEAQSALESTDRTIKTLQNERITEELKTKILVQNIEGLYVQTTQLDELLTAERAETEQAQIDHEEELDGSLAEQQGQAAQSMAEARMKAQKKLAAVKAKAAKDIAKAKASTKRPPLSHSASSVNYSHAVRFSKGTVDLRVKIGKRNGEARVDLQDWN